MSKLNRTKLAGLTKQQLRTWLAIFFLALFIPTTILIIQAYQQLKWEAFYQYRLQAEELSIRISQDLINLFNIEESRSFTEYSFLNVAGEPDAKFIQRSPLSVYPAKHSLPGVVGYFQIDAHGQFSSPLLPGIRTNFTKYGISKSEFVNRTQSANVVKQILSDNRLVVAKLADASQMNTASPKPVTEAVNSGLTTRSTEQETNRALSMPLPITSAITDSNEGKTSTEQSPSQAGFDRLEERTKQPRAKQKANTIGRVEDYKLESPYKEKLIKEKAKSSKLKSEQRQKKRLPRKEQSALPETELQAQITGKADKQKDTAELRIRIFESEIDSFEISLLDSGHFVVFRKVWRDNQRYIQGFLLEPKTFFNNTIAPAFLSTGLSESTNLAVAYQGSVFSIFSGNSGQAYQATQKLDGTLLAQTRLPTPFDDIELVFTLTHLAAGPGGKIIIFISAVLILVFLAGFYLMYRLGISQINLSRQQQDFVSAVSHELKTPLTSIRMYSEMLKQGWTDEEKQATYFNYIHDESERLSRLISNVLQLARMTRNNTDVELNPTSIKELIDILASKVSSQIESAGFELNIKCAHTSSPVTVNVDSDLFSQVMINLVDNAIKFSKQAAKKCIDIHCHLSDKKLHISIRDYGPGIDDSQLNKIFSLFYRAENELTRETVGTGIGLALVNQLVTAMEGEISVRNAEPGAEFVITFKLNT